VVIRPPLVHGHGAPGNLARLSRLVSRGVPLPLAGVDNRRSLIHVSNLARVLSAAITVPAAAGQTFHVRDRCDYSTPQIVTAAARAAGRRPRLFRAPLPMVQAAASITGRTAIFEQLTGWLQVDDRRARDVLGVIPRHRPLEIGSAAT
jgi:nucleoside-diphosphate-sugar epimerase